MIESQDGNMVEMPKYRCHKIVWALKIATIKRTPRPQPANCECDEAEGGAEITPDESGYAPFMVNADYLRRHKPEVGGYYVVYADGYKSYSPAQAFEEGYARIL